MWRTWSDGHKSKNHTTRAWATWVLHLFSRTPPSVVWLTLIIFTFACCISIEYFEVLSFKLDCVFVANLILAWSLQHSYSSIALWMFIEAFRWLRSLATTTWWKYARPLYISIHNTFLEEYLNFVPENIPMLQWFCGHWSDKRIGKMPKILFALLKGFWNLFVHVNFVLLMTLLSIYPRYSKNRKVHKLLCTQTSISQKK